MLIRKDITKRQTHTHTFTLKQRSRTIYYVQKLVLITTFVSYNTLTFLKIGRVLQTKMFLLLMRECAINYKKCTFLGFIFINYLQMPMTGSKRNFQLLFTTIFNKWIWFFSSLENKNIDFFFFKFDRSLILNALCSSNKMRWYLLSHGILGQYTYFYNFSSKSVKMAIVAILRTEGIFGESQINQLTKSS